MTVAVNVIGGFLGAGKTTAIRALLTARPPGERWAVLVNEFGAVSIDGPLLADADGIVVREVAGGCLCCVANLPLRVTVTELLRRARPDRLLIEPSGAAHPAGLLDALREEPLGRAIAPRAVVCLVDVRAIDRLPADPAADQIQLADVLVGSKADLASPAEISAFGRWAAAQFPPKAWTGTVAHGAIDPALLDLAADHGRLALVPDARRAVAAADGSTPPPLRPLPGRPVMLANAAAGRFGCGWIFAPEDVFDGDAVVDLVARFGVAEGIAAADVRAKGIVRIGRDWIRIDRVGREMATAPAAWRRDSRIEVLAAGTRPPAWDALGAALIGCRRAAA